MPCRVDVSPSDYANEIKSIRAQRDWFEAALCGAMSALAKLSKKHKVPGDVYGLIDYKEAGITEAELAHWHCAHMEADLRRREREAAEKKKKAKQRAREQARKKLIDSLTPEQRELLGVKK